MANETGVETVAPGARTVTFEACFNFRDLGGYPAARGGTVRWGRLFRADTLHRLTPADMARFQALGLRTVIDLRSATEIDEYGRLHEAASEDLDWHHVPMLDVVVLRPAEPGEAPDPAPASEALPPGESYVRMLGSGDLMARAFELLTGDGRLPAVFHCTAGRDRTGMLAAMVLDLLGVPDEVIAEDYVLTNEGRARSNAWIEEHEPTFAAYLAQFPPERRVTRPEVILGFLDGVRAAHGSVEDLLRSQGIDRPALERLRSSLLD